MTNQVNQYEHHMAIQEAYQIHDSDEYFKARPQLECGDRRKVFYAGHIRGYQAATKASESEINSLKERVAELQSHLSSQSIELAKNDVTLESYAHKVAELQAHINDLREALGTAKYELEMQGCNEPYADENSLLSYSMVKQALSATHAQALAEHDNDVTERIATALENAEGEFKTLPEYVSLVRALKATP